LFFGPVLKKTRPGAGAGMAGQEAGKGAPAKGNSLYGSPQQGQAHCGLQPPWHVFLWTGPKKTRPRPSMADPWLRPPPAGSQGSEWPRIHGILGFPGIVVFMTDDFSYDR